MDPKWKESSPRELLTTPVLNVLSSKVRCDRTGLEKQFYRFDFPSWVNIVALTPTEEIVLIRQYRFGSGKDELEIPGGAVEKDENPLDAGLRELLEETGYAGENGRIIGKVCPNPALQDNFCYTVLVENATRSSAPDLDDMEDIEVLTIPCREIFNLIRNGHISHGLVLNGIMFYMMHNPDLRL